MGSKGLRILLVWLLAATMCGCGGGSGSSSGGGTAPAVPADLAATAGNQQVGLTWTPSTGATSYHVKRSTSSGGPYTQMGAPSTTSYNDSAVMNGTKYFYVLSAVNASGESANSGEVSATPAPAVPPVPTGLTATGRNQQVSLSWAASTGATSYHVKRSATSGGPYTEVSAPAAVSFIDTGLANGTTY